jgi:hypothetical protein
VRTVIIPFTFDTINSTNNAFRINDNGTNRTITITPGFHTATTLAADVNASFIAAGSAVRLYAYDATNNPDFEFTGKLRFFSPDTFFLDWDHAANSDNTHYVLGFNNVTDSTAVAIAADFELFSDHVMDVTGGIRAIHVHSSLAPPNHMWLAIHDSMDPVIEMVPLLSETVPGDMVVYTPQNQSFFIVENFSQRSTVRFELRDNFDQRIDLKNKNWIIELTVDAIDL